MTAPLSRTFIDAREFAAKHAARQYLGDRGFSVGRWQAHAPCGILFGDYDIQKWRNLSPADIAALHGIMKGDGRHGPITVTITSSDPAIRAAFESNSAVMAESAPSGPGQSPHRSQASAAPGTGVGEAS